MADDSQISVALVAKIDQLESGMGSAADVVRESTARIIVALEGAKGASKSFEDAAKDSAEHTSSAFEHLEGTLKAALGVGLFLEFKEAASEAAEKVKEAFEATVGQAEKFALSNAKAASLLDTTSEQAAGLSAALHGVGSSIEEYESLALRLQQRLEGGGRVADKYKDSLSDSNGVLLTGHALMQASIALIEGASSAQEKNAISTELFGRRAATLYDVMRVGSGDIERNIQLLKDSGARIDGTKESAEELEKSMNELHTAWQGFSVMLGQAFMPVAVEVTKWLRDAVSSVGELTRMMTGQEDADARVEAQQRRLQEAIAGTTKALEESRKAEGGGVGVREEETPGTGTGVREKGGGGGGGGADIAKQLAEQAIAAREHQASEQVKIDQASNASSLALGRETLDESMANQLAAESRMTEIRREAIEARIALHSKDKVAEQKDQDDLALLEASHLGNSLKIVAETESKKQALEHETMQLSIRDSGDRLKEGIGAIEEAFRGQQISATERADLEGELTSKVFAEQIARLDAELATLTPGTKAFDDAYRQRETIVRKRGDSMRTISRQHFNDVAADVTRVADAVSGPLTSAFNAMLFHGKSFADGMRDLFAGMAESFVSMAEQIAAKWAITHITMAIVAKTTKAASALAQIQSDAAVGGAATAASTAAIPIAGPAAAIPAGLAMAGAISSTFSPLASAAGGMVLDTDRLVSAHKEEMILPANLSRGLQSMISGQGAGASRDVTLVYSPTVHAPADRSIAAQLDAHGSDVRSLLRSWARNGSL